MKHIEVESVSPVSLSRRRFLRGVGAAGGSVLLAAAAADPVTAAVKSVMGDSLVDRAARAAAAPRWLELVNSHTSESLHIAYRTAAGLVAPALEKLQWLLRDHRVGESAPIDTGLYDQLVALADAAGVEPRYTIISAYRSPSTNAALRAAGHGVATRSLHMQGRAIDVRLQGVSCAALRDLAITAARGGVGYYRSSDFVHLDTGRVRAWSG